MDLTRIILGEVTTEKAVRMKARKVALLRVHPQATKIEVARALRQFYGVEPVSVRIVRVHSKARLVARGRSITKRQAEKRAYVTLSAESKALDLTNFQT